MLEIKMNFVPYGDRNREKIINTIKISKIGHGKYAYSFTGENLNKDGFIEGFGENGALGLLKMILNECDEITQNRMPTKKELAQKYSVSEDTLQYRSDGRVE